MTQKDVKFVICKKHLSEIRELTDEDYRDKYTVKVVPTRECELCAKEGIYESLKSVIVSSRDLKDDDCESGVCPVR